MAKYKVLVWHGIPTQVRAEDENGRSSVRLSERFQLAIDEAAMKAKLLNDDDYTDGFQWLPAQERYGSAEEAAQNVAAELEEKYSDADIQALIVKIRDMAKDK